jgi:predicted ATPase/DNA-binding SARP family transcriptional activator
MPDVAVYLFGAPRIVLDGRVVTVERRKTLALLAFLAVAGRAHGREELITLLWPDLDAGRGRAQLRNTLADLQRAIGKGWLDAEGDQVGLAGGAGLWVDVARFHEMLAQVAAHSHPPHRACDVCLGAQMEAANLYTADFLAGFTLDDAAEFDAWQSFQTESLRLELAGVLEKLAAGLAGRGQWEAAIGQARRWLALDPLHEPAQRLLMQLHAGAGDRAAAIRQYQECVKVLQAELGIAPELETTALFEVIRTAQSPIAPLSPSPAPTHDLPPDPTPFIGREAELAQIAARLTDPACRLLTILGPGGMGKTRLAIQAARNEADRFVHGACFVDLTPVTESERLPSVILQALAVTGQGAADTQAELLRFLRDRHVLVVLDNFEHLVEEGATLLSAMLHRAPKVKLLVTSRVRLNLREEWLAPLEGMEVPVENLATLPASPAEQREIGAPLPSQGGRRGVAEIEELENHSATALFLACVGRLRPDPQLDDDDARRILHICRLLDGLPLAIELAAARARTMPLERIANELEHGLHLLTTSMRDVPQRHRSMTAALNHSWRLLSKRHRHVLRHLWVFRGGFTAEAAETVAAATPTDLEALTDASWLRLTSDSRYMLHESTRQYCEEKLGSDRKAQIRETPDQVRERHAAYYRALLNARAPDFYRRRGVVAETAREMDNLFAAWDWMLARDDLDGLWAMARSLTYVARHQAWHRAMPQVLEASQEKLRERPITAHDAPDEHSRNLLRAAFLILEADLYGNLYGSLGLWNRAEACVADARTLLGNTDQRDARWAETLGYLQGVEGGLAYARGSFVQAEAQFRALLVGLSAGNNHVWPYGDDAVSFWRANHSNSLGCTLLTQGRSAEAHGYVRQAMALAELTGSQSLRARAAWLLALVLHHDGDYPQAEKWGLTHIELLRADGDQIDILLGLYFMGALYQYWGKYESARSYLQQCIASAQAAGMYGDVTNSLTSLGHVALNVGDLAEARHLYEEALARCWQPEAASGPQFAPNALVGMGRLALAEGDFATARRYFWQVLRETKPSLRVIAKAMAGAARVLQGEGQLEYAAELCAFLSGCSAAEYATRQEMEQVLHGLEPTSVPDLFAAAVARGRVRDFDEVLAELVGGTRLTGS